MSNPPTTEPMTMPAMAPLDREDEEEEGGGMADDDATALVGEALLPPRDVPLREVPPWEVPPWEVAPGPEGVTVAVEEDERTTGGTLVLTPVIPFVKPRVVGTVAELRPGTDLIHVETELKLRVEISESEGQANDCR